MSCVHPPIPRLTHQHQSHPSLERLHAFRTPKHNLSPHNPSTPRRTIQSFPISKVHDLYHVLHVLFMFTIPLYSPRRVALSCLLVPLFLPSLVCFAPVRWEAVVLLEFGYAFWFFALVVPLPNHILPRYIFVLQKKSLQDRFGSSSFRRRGRSKGSYRRSN